MCVVMCVSECVCVCVAVCVCVCVLVLETPSLAFRFSSPGSRNSNTVHTQTYRP